MVKVLVRLWVALSIMSCGAAQHSAGGLEIPGPREDAGDEMVRAGCEEPDRAQRDFEIAEYLDRLESDGGRPVRATCRITKGMISVPGRERSDGYLALSADRWKALCRGRRTDGGMEAISWYLSGSAFSGAARLHAGSFVPDFGMGLLFGGSGGSSLSSSAFPFRNPRRIAGTTSFFLQTLHGGAVEIRYRNVYAAIFEGLPVTFGPNGSEAGERRISGARIEARRADAEIGFSGSNGVHGCGEYVWAIDGRWRSNRMNAGFEMGFGRSGEPGLLSGFSYRVPGSRAALLLYAIPPGAAGAFGSVNGRTPGGISSIGGAAAVVEHEVYRRIHARASFDRYERADGLHETIRQTTRLECERRGRKSLLRLAWVCAGSERRDTVPYPPAGDSGPESSQSLGFHSEYRIARISSIGVGLKRIEEKDGLGWLVAPVLRASLFSARLRITAAFAAYRAAFGHPACYFYAPALEGSFPMSVVSSDAERSAFVIGILFSKLRFFIHAALEDGQAPEVSLQASAGL